MLGRLTGKDEEKIDYHLIEIVYGNLPEGILERSKRSLRKADVTTEIRTDHLPYTG
jgi:hypothetical protein